MHTHRPCAAVYRGAEAAQGPKTALQRVMNGSQGMKGGVSVVGAMSVLNSGGKANAAATTAVAVLKPKLIHLLDVFFCIRFFRLQFTASLS